LVRHPVLAPGCCKGLVMSTECDLSRCAATSVGCFLFYSSVIGLSRLLSPILAPVSYKQLARKPGQQGFWDSSVASVVNAIVNCTLVLRAWYRDPLLFFGSPDPFYKTEDSCTIVVLFATWVAFDLVELIAYWPLWDGRQGAVVHHFSALVAWLLYLEGGYGHALSLVGVFCELTNPFMATRYFLSVTGQKESDLYMLNGSLFCLSWLLVRLCYAIPTGTYFILLHWQELSRVLPTWRLALYVGFFGVGCLLNTLWGYKLFTGAIKLLRAGKKQR